MTLDEIEDDVEKHQPRRSEEVWISTRLTRLKTHEPKGFPGKEHHHQRTEGQDRARKEDVRGIQRDLRTFKDP